MRPLLPGEPGRQGREAHADGSAGGRRTAQQDPEQGGNALAQVAPVEDHVDGAVIEQELAARKPSGSVSRTVCWITRGRQSR